MTGLLLLIVYVIRDSLTGGRYPDWYPVRIHQPQWLSRTARTRRQHGTSRTP